MNFDNSDLFERHSNQLIIEWLKQLRYFIFKRPHTPYDHDNDEFLVAFSYTDATDLINKLVQLGVHVKPAHDLRPISGIKSFKDLQQPGLQFLKGRIANIWIDDGYFSISVSGTMESNRYQVTGADFETCLELEKHFDNLGWQNLVDKRIEEIVNCISRSKYPDLFE